MDEYCKYTPPSYEIADSLMKLAQDIEISKGRVSVVTPPFLRQAADRVQRQADEIKRLRAALMEIARLPYSQERDNTAQDLAREVLGEDD
jgi:hypothetical protein